MNGLFLFVLQDRMKHKKIAAFSLLILLFLVAAMFVSKRVGLNPFHAAGDRIDSLDGVVVYYNGGFSHVEGRNLTKDGYNLGLKYQCVEFVKRYYYEKFDHEMPNSYGNAVDFFDPSVKDGAINNQRDLVQFTNGSFSKPIPGDLLIFGGTSSNPYGHVAIISDVRTDKIELIQQNASPSRVEEDLEKQEGKWRIANDRILGWLRMK